MAKVLCSLLALALALNLVQGSLFIPTHNVRSALKRAGAAGPDSEQFVCTTQITQRQALVAEKMAEVSKLMDEVKQLRQECGM